MLAEASLWARQRNWHPESEARMLASGHLAALSPSLCFLDTHFPSCIPHKAEAHGPQLGRFPDSQSQVLFPFPNCFPSLCLHGSGEESQDAVGAAASSQVCLFQDPSGLRPPAVATFTDSIQQGTDFLKLKKLTRKNPNERNHELRLSVQHELVKLECLRARQHTAV